MSTRSSGTNFITTHWSVVLAASGRDADVSATVAQAALEVLCRSYWPPVFAFIRARANNLGEADDLTQVDPRKGRFRSFLYVAVQHFLSNTRDRTRTLKRGGNMRFLSLDQLAEEDRHDLEPSSSETPERLFERRWATTFLARVLTELRTESLRESSGGHFDLLKQFLAGGRSDLSYAEVAAQLGLTEGALKMRVVRLRQRYGELIREEIAKTVADPAEVPDELAHLLRAVSP
ncbi:MAG: sigma-70 family RNA polymerase sigma factor [Verrucomicrobiales bacterium]|nr:sigma-70 family RNA polymerase sigma factor [Verrucomicrobiales bacterium]